MAISETHGAGADAVRQVGAAGDGMRRQVFPAIRWGAVLAGVAVGISVQLVLTLLGIAMGLSSTALAEGESMGTGPLIWAGISMLVAAFFGGYVAARMSGLKRKADGVLHGAVSWAVTTIMFVILATSVGGALVSGVFSNMNKLAGAAGAQTASGGQSPLASLLRMQGANVTPQAMRQLQQHLQDGQREQAVQLVGGTMGVEQAKAEALVDQALILAGTPDAASQQGKVKAEDAVRAAGTAAWVVFLTVALALAIGIIGGMLGARGSRRRVSWTGSGGR
ncbi:MAG TPA: hypothetical protein VIM12_19245 [Noviherbaspirillum sp.]|uniref:hypothetical protein n=1 Tax=Noviherbaspirillum sp. TaxID=1926288 RepID=UPI002F93187A